MELSVTIPTGEAVDGFQHFVRLDYGQSHNIEINTQTVRSTALLAAALIEHATGFQFVDTKAD